MCHRPGKDIDDNHPDHDQHQANHRRHIQRLSQKKPATQRNQYHPDTRPNGISHADGKGFNVSDKK